MISLSKFLTTATALMILGIFSFSCSSEKDNSSLPDTHSKNWVNSDSPDFHGDIILADISVLGSCAICHGDDFDGGKVDISCIDCHQTEGACTSCHGGVNNNTGAPPKGLENETDDTTLAVGAHTIHLTGSNIAGAYPCNTCHIVPVHSTDTSHYDLDQSPTVDSIAEITWGGIVDSSNAVWDRTTGRCQNLYCHGNFFGGYSSNAPIWNGTNQAQCSSCHDTGENPVDLKHYHEFHIEIVGLLCYNCHASVVDILLNITQPALHVNGVIDTVIADRTICNNCHGSGVGSCTTCHGDLDNQTGAPPYGLRGEVTTDLRSVGAHTSHVEDGSFADAFNCDACHIQVLSVSDTTHLDLDSIAEITWGEISDGSGSWNRTTNECSNTYCHGNFKGGNHNNTPVWTAQNQSDCGSCHDEGSNPSQLLWKHNFHIETVGLDCAECHASVVDVDKNIIDISLHVNGQVDTLVNSLACDNCHGTGEGSCVSCHGGVDNQTGAPPQGIEGELLTTDLAVGAHTNHVSGGNLAEAINCSTCHIVPLHWTDTTHLGADFNAEITWGGIAGLAASWDRATAECSDTYCHGDFRGGYASNIPVWTDTNQADCGSCHDAGTNPADLRDRHDKHVNDKNLDCFECHSTTVDVDLNIINKSIHVNGTNNVSFANAPDGTYSNGSCANVGVSGCHENDNPKTW